MSRLRQFTDILQYPFASIYRDFTIPRLRQFILQSFYDTRLRQFTEILRYPFCVNLQRFYDTPFASIYRDFMMPSLC